jgi:hypothetical protein
VKVFVATPVYRQEVMAPYVTSIVRDTVAAAKAGYEVLPPTIVNNTYVHWGRNTLAEVFYILKEFDQMLFIDSDLGWDVDGVQKILETPGDIAGGIYRCKKPDIFYPFEGKKEDLRAPYSEVISVPTGFMRISRHAMETILAEHPYPFDFMTDVDGKRLGEDIAFCRRARSLGLSIYARFDILFEHVGDTSWLGRAIDDLEITA